MQNKSERVTIRLYSRECMGGLILNPEFQWIRNSYMHCTLVVSCRCSGGGSCLQNALCSLYNHLTSALRQIPNAHKSWTLDSVFRVHSSLTESPSNCNYKYNYVPNSKFLRHSIAPEDDVVQCRRRSRGTRNYGR